MEIKSFKIRIKILSVFIFFLATILFIRLFFLQVIHKDAYLDRADKQYFSSSSGIFDRGSIYLTKKDGTFLNSASISSGFKLILDPSKIEDPNFYYEKLSPYLELDKESFIKKISNKNDKRKEVGIHLSKTEKDEIMALLLNGVSFEGENWRFYPGNELACHSIGFVGYKGDERVGQYGLEKYYNDVLSKPKGELYVNFFAEVFTNIKNTVMENNGQGNLITTIEPNTQSNLEAELREVDLKWKPDMLLGIIINPMNGEIYGLSSLPNYDLNNYQKVEDISIFSNPIVENVFEFGSVIKPLVVAGALDVGVIDKNTKYFDKGSVVIDKKEIFNFDKKGRGSVNVQTILNQSLNTGMVFVEEKMGHNNFRNYMKNYGIGEKTGIDLPNETKGLIKNLESPRNIEYANASFGQGIAITPIEAVVAFSSLANGGKIITPHLVKEIKYENGEIEKKEYQIVKENILKKEITDTVTSLLINVFESYNEGKYKMENYSIASKTGTAQIPNKEGGYYKDRHAHAFFGYFPAYDPKFLVFLFMTNPKGATYASQTLIPPFVNITKFLLNYYNVPPDR